MAKAAGYSVVILIAPVKLRIQQLPIWLWQLPAGQIKTGSLCRSDRVAKYNSSAAYRGRAGNAVAPYRGRAEFKA